MTRGGKRFKAGRRPSDDPKERITIFVPRSIVELLNREKCRNIAIEAIIFEAKRVMP